MFWGNKILALRLKELITEYDESRLDRATYRLRIGPEIYVSPTGEPADPKNKPKALLAPGAPFTIPAGQFAFLLTQESITVPNDAIAFISIRASYKFRGLINVSGFHVDPGYNGRLIFAVFNAGPGPVHLAQGEECFHIWYGNIEGAVEFEPKIGPQSIPSNIINSISGEIQSFAGLDAKIRENDKKLVERISKVEREHEVVRWAAALIIGVIITLGLRECSTTRPSIPPPPPTATLQAPLSPVPTVPPAAPSGP
jgi:dCTP deaminase